MLLSHQRGGASVAFLEIVGRKGIVQVNGKTFERNSNIILTGGDELIFSSSGKHAYVSLLILCLLFKAHCRLVLRILEILYGFWFLFFQKGVPYLLVDISAT